MKHKKGYIAAVAFAIISVAIMFFAITKVVLTKKQVIDEQTETQPFSTPPQQQQIAIFRQDVQDQPQTDLPIINLNKFEEKSLVHVTVEYRKNIHDNKNIIHIFKYEKNQDFEFEYKVSHLSNKYLVIQRCSGQAPCSDFLFDLNNLQLVEFTFPTLFGNVSFFENEKYVAVFGPGRSENPGMAIEIIDGKKVYCLISSEEVSNVDVNNGVMSFAEYAFTGGEIIATKKQINIADFCKINSQKPSEKQTTLIKAKEDEAFVHYNGSITVSGKFRELHLETLMGGELCFYTDEETGYLIPRDSTGGTSGDSRIPWFCFNNQNDVKKQFGINDDVIFSDKSIDYIQGEATVVISNYKVDKRESEVFDTATLKKIVSKDPYEIVSKE